MKKPEAVPSPLLILRESGAQNRSLLKKGQLEKLPVTVPAVHTRAMTVQYLALSSFGTKSVMIISTIVINPPPPRPCMALLATSISMDVLTAQRIDPIENAVIAIKSNFLRPNISDIFPYTASQRRNR